MSLSLVQPVHWPSSGHEPAFDTAAVPLLILDMDGTIEVANRAAVDAFGDVTGSCFDTLDAGGLRSQNPDILLRSPSFHLTSSDGRVFKGAARSLQRGGFVVSLNDVSDYIRLTEQAQNDELTGLLKRGEFLHRLDEAVAHAKRHGTTFAVLCLDLDRFKFVNDTLGHAIGDLLLQKVVQRIATACRTEDVVARLGGDEFAILQTAIATPHDAEVLAARLVDLIGRTYVIEGHSVNVGLSIGIAMSPSSMGPDTETEPAVLLKHADLALYRAKSGGRGCFRFFETEMDAIMQERRALEIDLRRALALKEFMLAYQPQVDLDSDTVVGFEALLRWQHPDRGLVSPAAFIPIAEESGLITQIGNWVIRTACMEAANWSKDTSIAVNVSPVQFRAPGLIDAVLSALAASCLAPERLELEITEGALLDETDTVLTTLFRLREIGVRISMDDFGTGYSSLSYLQKFPFDKIKIDQSFVRGADDSEDCKAILKAVAAIGLSLGIKTTAEGVETAEQLLRIRTDGCTQVQQGLRMKRLGDDLEHVFIVPTGHFASALQAGA